MLYRFSKCLRDTSIGSSSNVRSLLAAEEGAVFVEYLTITLLVAIVCAAATLTLGDPLLRRYRMQQAVIVMPIP
jgi:Flp pilus assembly pilin Flp